MEIDIGNNSLQLHKFIDFLRFLSRQLLYLFISIRGRVSSHPAPAEISAAAWDLPRTSAGSHLHCSPPCASFLLAS